MIEQFKTFVSRGNLVEVGVGLVMALAFKAVVDAFIDGLVMPLVAALFGEPSFDALTITINDTEFLYGTFITQAVIFLLIAVAVFVFVVKPFNTLQGRFSDDEADDPAPPPEEIKLLRQIRDVLESRT